MPQSMKYIVRNVTDSIKTMLDLVKEAVDGVWFNASWPHEADDKWIEGNEYDYGQTAEGIKIPLKERQLYLERVEEMMLFPPHMDVYIEISPVLDSFYGEICIFYGGLKSSKNFKVRRIDI
ncbi:MAG: hypothetical protein ACFFFC_02310 [Candidatus Thorarchaeota archaeon]